MGNAHVCKLTVGEGIIYLNNEELYHFDLVEEYFNRILHVVQCLNRILVLHGLAMHDLPVLNVDPIYQLCGRLVGVSHDEIFSPFNHWLLIAATQFSSGNCSCY